MSLRQRLDLEPDSLERDLARLVLTVVELVRQLMERQAIRRVEGDTLTPDQIEDLGRGLMRLEQAMATLRETFGLRAEELNIDLGPLGTLLPDQEPA